MKEKDFWKLQTELHECMKSWLQAIQTAQQKHLQKRFHVDNNDMVLEKDIHFYSFCEHHMLPFYGNAAIAYIPNGEVVGLSKIARTVEVLQNVSSFRNVLQPR